MKREEEIKGRLAELVSKYKNLQITGRLDELSEATIKAVFIEPLFEFLGWNMKNTEEVSREEKVSHGRADYAFKISNVIKFFVEAKGADRPLDAKEIEQAINYAYHKSVPWAVLTNFGQLKIYNTEWVGKRFEENRFLEFTVDEYIDRFDELKMLGRESMVLGELDRYAERVGKKLKRKPVTTAIFENFLRWQKLLSRNIAEHDVINRLEKEEIAEGVQRLLNRFIFIRTCEDRSMENEILRGALRQWKLEKKKPLIRYLSDIFYDLNLVYDSDLFSPHFAGEVHVDNEIMEKVINELYESEDGTKWHFSDIDADVLGSIYEKYLATITSESGSVLTRESKRKEMGIFYTPTFIVDYIVKNTLGEVLSSLKYVRDIEKVRILDPACGSGSFLIKAYEILYECYRKLNTGDNELLLDDKLSQYSLNILTKNLYGVDLDKKAVEITQLNLLIRAARRRGRLPPLSGNIVRGNSLISGEPEELEEYFGKRWREKHPLNWEEKFPKVMEEGGFDVIIGNPPYVRIQSLDEDEVEYFNDKYKSATKNYDIYVLFVERGLSLLKRGGVLGYILPSKFFNADYGKGLRKVIAGGKFLYKIVNFKDFQVFDGATTYTCLLFLKKEKNAGFYYFEIGNRENFGHIKEIKDSFLIKKKQIQPLKDEVWNFSIGHEGVLIDGLKNIEIKLGDISKNIFQGLVTGADKIYFVDLIEEKARTSVVKNHFDGREYTIEKSILKKIIKGKEIGRWKIMWNRTLIVYPYLVRDGSARLIEMEELKKNYPGAYGYFSKYQKELKKRERNRFKNETNWHQFGRLQNIEKFEQPKIITQVLASRNSFTFDEEGEYYFVGGGNAGGYGIVLKEEFRNDYHFILSLLNSRLLEFYLKRISTPFRGGFFSYGKRFIERFPIILPPKSEREKIAKIALKQLDIGKFLVEKSGKETGEKKELEHEMVRLDEEIDKLVYEIYQISSNEVKIIEEETLKSAKGVDA